MSETLIDALRQKSCYRHEVKTIDVIESDLAWIVLTGNFAYKIKKPIDLYFLDASSLEARHTLCQSEFKLNQRSYQEMYLDVVGIYHSETGVTVEQGGGAVSYTHLTLPTTPYV